MNIIGVLKNPKIILIVIFIILTISIALIHNIFFNENNNFGEEVLIDQSDTKFEAKPDSVERNDFYYFQSAISAFNTAKENNSLTEIEISISNFNLLFTKYPKSKFSIEAKPKLQEAVQLKTIIKKHDLIVYQIDSLSNLQEYTKAVRLLSRHKNLIDTDEYEKLMQNAEEKRNRPIQISLRELLSESIKYDGKIVEVTSLKAISNDVQSKYFSTYKSTGYGKLDFDTDLAIKVYYNKALNRDELIYLTGDEKPELTVIGKFVNLSFIGSYIDAKEVRY